MTDASKARAEGLPASRRFDILEEIGSGGAGRVYLANDRYTGAGPIALKVLDPERSDAPPGRPLEREFLALRELCHPGLVRVFERGILPETGAAYFTSEFLPGTDFPAAAREGGFEKLIDLTVQALRVLEYIHRRGYVHCDLKPGNLLVTEGGVLKLLDFGLASREGRPREEGRLRGTLPYVAPEMLEGHPVDRRMDLYSLGVVLYSSLAGQAPPRGSDLLPDFDAVDFSGLPAPFAGFLPLLLARDPAHRPASAAAALEDLAVRIGRELPLVTEEALKAQVPGGRFVGREVELGTLMTELREIVLLRTSRSAARVPLLRGEPGIGKHQLLLEFKDRCQREGVDFFSAGRVEGGGAAYAGLAPILRALVARVGPDTLLVARARPVLGRVLTEMVRDGEETAAGRLSGKEERIAWLEGIVQFLRAASGGPAGYVLVFEEIHAAPVEVVELLGYVIRSLFVPGEACPPILVALTLRDDEEPPETVQRLLSDLADDGLLLPVDLRGFTEDEAREFVSAAAGIPEPPQRLVGDLLERTGGNPLFLELLLGALVEDGSIAYVKDRWRVRETPRTRLPESVLQVAANRVAGLSETESAALELVAVYGDPVPRDVLERLQPEIAAAAGTLLRRRILAETEDGRCLTFRHPLVGRLVLDRAGPRLLRTLHSRIAEVLSALAVEQEIQPAKIAHHHSLGEDRRTALRWSLQAAASLTVDGRHDEAAIFHMRALARVEREDPRRPELLEALGDAHEGAGRLELAVSSWRKALDEFREPAAKTRLHRKLGEALDRSGAYAEAMVEVRKGLERVDAADPAARIPFLRLLGGLHRRLGDYGKAIQAIREGLRLARGERTEETASLLNLLGNVYMLMGDHRNALNFQLRSLRFSESIGFDAGSGSALHNLGTLMRAWGDPDRAIEYYKRSLRINDRLMNLPAVALTYNNIANIHSDAGDFTRAEYYHRRCLGLRKRIGDPFGIAMSFGNIGSMHRLRGQWGLAIAYYERSIRHFLRIANEHGAAFFRAHLAELLLEIGAFDQAEAILSLATLAASRYGFRRIEARSQLLRGRLLRLRGNPDEALRLLEEGHRAASETVSRQTAVAVLLELARSHRDRGRKGLAFRAVQSAQIESRKLLSPEAAVRCGFLRSTLESATEGAAGGETTDGIGAYLDFARAVRRPEAIVDALEARTGRHLLAGDLAAAAEDVREALADSEGIADSLPGELAGIYRNDPRRGKLVALAGRIRSEIEQAGNASADAALSLLGRSMKPENLSRLFEINKRLNSETDLPRLLETIMDTAVELTGAERGFLILVDGGHITFQVARNFRRKEVEEPEIKISQSIVRQVISTGETVLTDNAIEDERFSKYRSVDNLKLTSILSVPFQSRGLQLGALYLDNRARRGVFTEEDVETLKALADQAAIAIVNLQNRQRLTERLEAQTTELTRVKMALEERPYKNDYHEIIARSSRMKEVFLLLDKIIDTEVPVLIQGESGTGKELVARAVHFMGPRKNGPFTTVNCGAVPDSLLESEFFGYVKGAFTGAGTDKKGLFEQAHKGTLFLDEIGDMDFDMQMKLLRVLQQGEIRPVGGNRTVKVDVRIVCATNKDLRERMMERKFREDLYYRINVISVTLPPLRDRREDVPLLARHFMEKTAADMGMPMKELEQGAMALLTAYDWPGNVRELENEIKKAVALSDDSITPEDLSIHIQGERADPEPRLAPQVGTLKETMEATEKSIISRALEETGGNQTRAAKNLGISRVWLRKKMEKYGLLD